MSKKKKIISSKKENLDSISYEGNIKVSILKGKKVCSTNIYKNSGRWPLFLFLNMCLKGDYKNAEILRPNFIDVFYCGEVGDGYIPNIIDAQEPKLITYLNSETRKTLTTIPSNLSKKITTKEDNIGSSSIKYEFIIPFTQLVDGITTIDSLALYSSNSSGEYQNPCAFFFIKGEKEKDRWKFGNLLKNISTENIKRDEYSLYIEWTLSLTNNHLEQK